VIGDFTLSSGGAYDRAVMERFPNATCFTLPDGGEGCVNSQQDLSGKAAVQRAEVEFQRQWPV